MSDRESSVQVKRIRRHARRRAAAGALLLVALLGPSVHVTLARAADSPSALRALPQPTPAHLRAPDGLPPVQTEAGVEVELLLDFEDGSATGWHARDGDEPYLQYSVSTDGLMEGRGCLAVTVQGWDTTFSNEEVRLLYDLPEPILIDSTAVVSWRWWVRDRRANDGVGLRIALRHDPGIQTSDFEWASHSLHARGDWPFTDPAQQVVQHVEPIGKAYHDRYLGRTAPLPFPWVIRRIELFAWFPYDQTFYVDEIRIGVPDPDLSSARAAAPSAQRESVTPSATSLLVMDLNGDRHPDRLIGCAGHPPLIWLGVGDNGWRQVDPQAAGLGNARSLVQPQAVDLDRDGILDLLGISEGRLLLYRGLGNACFAHKAQLQALELPWNPPANLRAADLLPGTALPQVLLTRVNGVLHDTLYVQPDPWRLAGRPAPSRIGFPETYGYRTALLPLDVDNDGDLDLFATNSNLFLQGPAGLHCASARWIPEPGYYQAGACAGDIDNDGDLDLFIAVDYRREHRPTHLTHRHSLLYRNDGDHFTDVTTWIEPLPGGHAQLPLLADFDLDGDLDLLHGQANWNPESIDPSVYLENDGTGSFHPGPALGWLCNVPRAQAMLASDLDDDGDLDLMVIRAEDDRVEVLLNPLAQPRSVKARVLDSRGAPHAGGARVTLHDARGALAGFRQTGVGTVLPGWGEIVFGCPGEGPYTLTVTFPSQPENPVRRLRLHPGDRVVVVEPLFAGWPGAPLARLRLDARRWAAELAEAGGPLMLPPALLYGMLVGALLYAHRRRLRVALGRGAGRGGDPLPATPPAPGPLGGWFGRRRRIVITLLAALLLLPIAGAATVWPPHPQAIADARVAGLVAGAGLLLGLGLARLDSSRRQAVVSGTPEPAEARQSLIEAIDGFSHAAWMKALAGTALLCQGLIERGDPEAILPRLQRRLAAYREVVAPQMTRIAEHLPAAHLDPTLTHSFLAARARIAGAVERIERHLAGETPAAAIGDARVRQALADLAAAAGALHGSTDIPGTTERIFQRLGAQLRTDPLRELEAALQTTAEVARGVSIETALPPATPEVFADPGELANIFENLIRNALRAVGQTAATRPARLRIAAQIEGGLVTFTFRDSGPGIPAEASHRLFAAAAPGARRGRGLPYAWRRLKAWDGKIVVAASDAQHGTTIAVTLRALAPAERYAGKRSR